MMPFAGWLPSLIIWLALIRHFFDTGWVSAFLIALLAIVIFVVVAVALGLLFGIVLLGFLGF